MNIIFEYISYSLRSKKRHGVHSPFVYELTDRCLSYPLSEEYILISSELKERLRSDNRIIQMKDAGAGSRKLKIDRSVSEIYYVAATKGKYAKLLFRLTAYYKPKQILEFGTSLGVGTMTMAIANSESVVETVEACPSTLNIAKENFEHFRFSNILNNESTFEEYLNQLTTEQFDLIFIDGHHDGEALKYYVKRLLPHSHDNTFFVLDDIRWNAGMKSAFIDLCSWPEFHVSIDLFKQGILLKRTIQEKEHFMIRI